MNTTHCMECGTPNDISNDVVGIECDYEPTHEQLEQLLANATEQKNYKLIAVFAILLHKRSQRSKQTW